MRRIVLRRIVYCKAVAVIALSMGTVGAGIIPTVPSPDSVYLFNNDIVVVEAEDLGPVTNWQFETNHSGYTGRGYMRYSGPQRACEIYNDLGEPVGWDTAGICQGNNTEWLKVPVKIETAGAYSVNIRNFHLMSPHDANSDCHVWTHVADYELPIKMSHADNQGQWGFLRFGPGYPGSEWRAPIVSFRLYPGIYTFFVSGRGQNFCADRIHIYRSTGPAQYPDDCVNAGAPVSTKVPVDYTPAARRPGMTVRIAEQGASTVNGVTRLTPSSNSQILDLRGRSLGEHQNNGSLPRGIVIINSARL